MKRSKRLYALLGILAVACIATFAVTRMEEKKERIKAAGEIVLELPADTVTGLSWEYGETALAFHRDGTWLYDGDFCLAVVDGQTFAKVSRGDAVKLIEAVNAIVLS